jgi:CheY-like chemotaxis protein
MALKKKAAKKPPAKAKKPPAKAKKAPAKAKKAPAKAKKAPAKAKKPPAKKSPPPALAPTYRSSAPPPFARLPADVHILVVDDEPEVLNLLVPYLRKRGFNVTEAEDGDQALERILTEHPDIVLLDVMMPGLNGWEISQYVRDRPELDHVRIIMATGIGSETNAATAPIYGADAYIDKPFRLEEVDQAVRGLIARLPAPRA